MNESKNKYYWIKLRTDFFNREDIDFLLSQENGCEYVVLYQMLCLSSANTNGRLESQMNEVIIPYDTKKIVRDCKYFDYDTVVVALELYKKLGLIYEEEDKILKISNIETMIGSESASKAAIKKREQRLKKKVGTKKGTNCLIENRDKILDNRDIDIRDKNININNNISSSSLINNNIYDYLQDNGFILTPIHYEVIQQWDDNELTRYAIKKAVLNGKYNINYIDKILFNWKKENITTLEQAKAQEDEFEKAKEFREKLKNEKKMSFSEKLDMWSKEWEDEEEKND